MDDDFEEIINENYDYVKPITREEADRLAEGFVLGLDPKKPDPLDSMIYSFAEIPGGIAIGSDPAEEKKEGRMKSKATPIEGFVVLVLFVLALVLFVSVFREFGWSHLRLVGGIIVFVVLLQFSTNINKEH